MTNYRDAKYQLPASGITSGTLADARISESSVTQHAGTFDDNKLQTNIALLGFKTAVNGSLAKYNLVDQIVDEYSDSSGVDASASTNEFLKSGAMYGGTAISVPTGATSTDTTSIAGYKIHVLSAGSGNFVVGGNVTVDILLVGGGGAGGNSYAGGAGAGGVIYKPNHVLTAQTFAWVTGAGAAQNSTNDSRGANGADSTLTDAGATVQFIAKGGGGGGGEYNWVGSAGGSGGGTSYGSGGAGGTNQASQSGDSGTYGFGFAGGGGSSSGNNAGGGGGAGSVGVAATSSKSGNGGAGKYYGAEFGTTYGDSGWFASGGGGADGTAGTNGTASAGGGTDGVFDNSTRSDAAQANTGGGSGGGNDGDSGAGGSGLILIKHATPLFTSGANLTLQSNDTTASAADPNYGDMVVLMEDVEGTATLNTDIKGYISEDSGVTFTQGNLVQEGTWGTDKKIVAFHDLDISAQSGSAMCYKITTHNQSAGSKETLVHATSIGWR